MSCCSNVALGIYIADRIWIHTFEIFLFIGIVSTDFCLLQLSSLGVSNLNFILPLYLITGFLVSYFIWWQQYILFIELIFAGLFLVIKMLMTISLILIYKNK